MSSQQRRMINTAMNLSIFLSTFIFVLFFLHCTDNYTKNPSSLQSQTVRTQAKVSSTRILVYPFENIGDKQFDWVSAGITDTVVSDLSKYPNISIVTNEDRKKALNEILIGQKGIFDNSTITETGKLTGSSLILTGSYLVFDEKIRVNTRIIHVENGIASKAVKIDGQLKQLFELQDKIVLTLFQESQEFNDLKLDKNKNPSQPVSYFMYAKGEEFKDVNPKLALEYYKQAISISPEYIHALIRAGSLSLLLNQFSDAFSYFERGVSILKKQNETETESYAILMSCMGLAHKSRRDYYLSLEYFHKSKQIYESLNLQKTSPYYTLMENMGTVYKLRGDSDTALKYYRSAEKK